MYILLYFISAKPSASEPEAWARLQGYMGAHDHLKGIDRGQYAAKVRLLLCGAIITIFINFHLIFIKILTIFIKIPNGPAMGCILWVQT